jgi:hypothetical protein
MGGSRLAGFKIDAPGGVMASVGAEGGDEAVLENLEIVGASRSAVVFGERSRGVLRGSYVHDNPEVAVLVTRQALPTLVQNVITANGRPSAGAARMPDAAGHVRPAVVLEEGASAVFFGNVIAGNADDQVWGLAAEKKSDVLRDNVIGLPAPSRNAAPVRPPAAGAPRR